MLNPKISLSLGYEERYQEKVVINGIQKTPSITMPSLSLGASYVLNKKTSFNVNGSMGSSASSPDSVVSVSLWRKF